MPGYTIDELDDHEEHAKHAKPDHQRKALAILVKLFAKNGIEYGVMGGMNFFLRGSPRTTGDVDVAVNNKPSMEALLHIFDREESIYRPTNRLQWAGGVARIFVVVNKQPVQFDLMPKGSEGHLIPQNIARSVDKLQLSTTPSGNAVYCNILAIGPLVATKIKAHDSRGSNDDYIDLKFVCCHPTYRSEVRAAAEGFRPEWKQAFLERVMRKDPKDEKAIRWALNMEVVSAPPRNQPQPSQGRATSATSNAGSRHQQGATSNAGKKPQPGAAGNAGKKPQPGAAGNAGKKPQPGAAGNAGKKP